MDTLIALLTEYGAISVFFVVLFVQLGLPIPVLPLLLLVGSLASINPLLGILSFGLAIIASLCGDYVWYAAGRRYGHRTLHMLCRISLSADSCVRQTEGSFTRWGAPTLIVAKFIPGLATLAPPLAGALGLGRGRFLLFSTLGAALWAGGWLTVGALFAPQIDVIINTMAQFGQLAFAIFCVVLIAYIAYRWLIRYRLRVFISQARITPHDLAELLTLPQVPLIFDARSTLVKTLDIQHIAGARPVDPKQVHHSIKDIPLHTPIITYCSCPNDVSAIKVTKILQKKGYTQAKSLHGGIDAWREAGFPVERSDA